MANNKKVVAGAGYALENLKTEIAADMGIQLGADTSARLNGQVGGEITKRLIALAEAQLGNLQ